MRVNDKGLELERRDSFGGEILPGQRQQQQGCVLFQLCRFRRAWRPTRVQAQLHGPSWENEGMANWGKWYDYFTSMAFLTSPNSF